VNADYDFEVEEFDPPAEYESDPEGEAEYGRYRPRQFAATRSSGAPRPGYTPRRFAPARPGAGAWRSQRRPPPRPRPRPLRPPYGRRIYLYAPESPAASEYVRWVQTLLNQALDLQLRADGVMNVQTRSAIRSFQQQQGLPVTGVVGPDTEKALVASGSGPSAGGAAAGRSDEPPTAADEPPAAADKPPAAAAGEPDGPADEPSSTVPAGEFGFSWESMTDEFAPGYGADYSACPPFTPVAVEKEGGKRIQDKTIPSSSDLVVIQGAFAKTPLHRLAAEALHAVVCAARKDGIKHPLLLPTGGRSGFRDPKMQSAAWQRALVKYKTEAEARKWVAKPGFSPHQTGRAIDLYLGISNDSANVARLRRTPAYKWMVANAHRFGFYPYQREPWHWEYNPPRGGQPAGGQPEVGSEWESEFEWEGESALDVLSPSELKAVKITSTFETGRPGGFGGLTGNFDGQGLSFGLMNFAFKAGSLPPLLQEFITKHPGRYAAAFGQDAERFKEIVFATKPDPANPKRRVRDVERQMDFVNTQMNQYPQKAKGNKIVEPWKTYFGRLENDAEFRKIQVKAVRRALERARYWYDYFGFKTERGFAFMFDLVSSHGAAWLNAPKFKGKRRALLQKMLAAKKSELGQATLTEPQTMEVIANMIADVSLPEWRKNVRVRKLWFVKGAGRVHGHLWDIAKDFGVTGRAPDFGATGAHELEWEAGRDDEAFQWDARQDSGETEWEQGEAGDELQLESGESGEEFQWESDAGGGELEYEQASVATAPPLLGPSEQAAGGESFYVKIGLGKGLPASTGVFIPGNFRPGSNVSIVVYLHGHKSMYPGNSVLIKGYWDGARFPFFALREEIAASRRNVIFVAPSLGTTSQAGNLVLRGGFDSFMAKVIAAINAHYLQPRGMQPLDDVQEIILAAHSGGGSPMLRIATGKDRYAAKVKACWGFDSMYGGVAPGWLAWAKAHPDRTYFAYFGPSRGYTNQDGRYVASPRDNAENIACAARRQNLANVCMQPSRAVKKGNASAHFWVPKVHLAERLQNNPCSAGDVCPQSASRRRSALEVAPPAGMGWSAISGEAIGVPTNGR
jgi:hypothetical protein